jgi:hypothetical protein
MLLHEFRDRGQRLGALPLAVLRVSLPIERSVHTRPLQFDDARERRDGAVPSGFVESFGTLLVQLGFALALALALLGLAIALIALAVLFVLPERRPRGQ